MKGHARDGLVHVGGDARQRFYDSRGYGRPREGDDVVLAPVEAAHLLFRGDLDAVEVEGSDCGFADYLARQNPGFGARFVVYADLRDRGFYLSPAREGWVDESGGIDFVVHPRGDGPWDDTEAYRVRTVSERADVSASALGDVTLAVVDEESDITYFETERLALPDDASETPPAADGVLLDDRVVVWEPPTNLHHEFFYGQPLTGRAAEHAPLQLSLVEAAHLAAVGVLAVDGGVEAVVAHGRDAEGDRFDRRLRAYRALRDAGYTPKTGFKFGADFRVYHDIEDADNLGHSPWLVRSLPADHTFSPRDVALDVRLAHGVRKRMVFALDAQDSPDWLAVSRLTP
ncbi:tRNA-intron lyase [Salarchaeum sp. III]|uniref:tRNA-intron lyase n=1 Tax=Salarchaeum sp. III TaxID=3107927 RepID=UPI002EDB9152